MTGAQCPPVLFVRALRSGSTRELDALESFADSLAVDPLDAWAFILEEEPDAFGFLAAVG